MIYLELEKFVDDWIGPNMFGGYLPVTPKHVIEAAARCAAVRAVQVSTVLLAALVCYAEAA